MAGRPCPYNPADMDEGSGRKGSTSGRAVPSVALVWGEDEFLLRESAHDLLAEHGLRADEVDAADWRGGDLQ